jgi:nucleoid-associated protein YgaU
VRAGDTLWSLAKRFGDPGAYILDRVDTLAAANGLASDARLMPGQRIIIPVTGADDFIRVQAAARR